VVVSHQGGKRTGTGSTEDAPGAAGAVLGLRPGEGATGEGLPRAWGGHREGHPPGGNTDEVDDLVAAWHSQRPDLDVAPLHVLSRVSRLARHLDIARRGAFAAHGLESWEFDVLSALRRAGPPFQLTPGALLRATLVTSGTMTNRIDRLAAAGFVSREPDPRDRRGVLVTLSARGEEAVDAAFTDLLERERALLASLQEDQRDLLAGLLRTLLVPFDEGAPSGGGNPARGNRAAS
jgi:DNA-binding MarR family transcriptional regulator